MIGLPETGKTSFLAAFVYYVEAEIEIKRLTQYKLSSNTTYITLIRQSWLKGVRPERTKVSASKNKNTTAEIYLRDTQTNENITLHICDNFGEAYESQFNLRYLDSEYLAQIKHSAGMILFIHPVSIQYPTLIEDLKLANDVADLINSSIGGSEEGEDKDGETKIPESDVISQFKIEETPTSVVLVDLLESHLEFSEYKPMNLAVVVSAWDVVKGTSDEISPLKWIELNLPLLYQYLITNFERLNFKTFGISAVGGNITDPVVAESLRKFHEPMERVMVVEDEGTHKNIASPVEWILNQWQAKRP